MRDGSKQRGYHVTDRINLVELQHPPEGGTQLRPEGWHTQPNGRQPTEGRNLAE